MGERMGSTVYVVDDDPDVCKALNRLLASEGFIVSVSHSTQEFLGSYDSTVPACIILDLSMPGMSGLELQAQLQANDVSCPVIFLTGYGDIPSSVRAMKAGALDFLTKPVDADALLEAVRQAVAVDEAIHRSAMQSKDARTLFDTLTPREREVVPYLLTGRLNKQIAADLGVAEKTIKVHRSRVMQKLGVRTPIELLAFLERSGLQKK
ncbi:response regulator [Stenotrophomonas sp. SY1]|uniref:response regulator transcription factor n=1 Tax=Stenotrophomonas sp. SY1 TaxID=477235 RepID=UPI001E47A272|nr:response regulator [Stenotrophomonas sp. SY1]MCD9087033.1 response regulator [Stenotrophomonas sp. SY1]